MFAGCWRSPKRRCRASDAWTSVTNYRCPASVVGRAVRLVELNQERFRKRIAARPDASGPVILAPTGVDDVERCVAVLRAWPREATDETGATRAILARTNRELLPAVVAALVEDVAFRATGLEIPVDSPLRGRAARCGRRATRRGATPRPACVGSGAGRRRRNAESPRPCSAWAPAFATLSALEVAIADVRSRLARLRRDDAALTLATAHGTKGLEFDHVAVIGMDEGRFPSARSIADAEDPARALEEERRLAYVAWTRARRSLTLVYDPDAPSRFLREAFDPWELEPAA